NLADAGRELRLNELIEAACKALLDLVNGPVIRVTLIKSAHESHYLVINIHHIAADHGAVSHCIDEIGACYSAYRAERAPELTTPELQYADYVIWHEENSDKQAVANKLENWKNKLAGVGGLLDLPLDRPRPHQPSFSGRQYPFSFDNNASDQIVEFSRSAATSLYQTFLTSLAVLLSRYCNQNEVVIGTPFSNREIEELDRVMGCFINTLPIVTDLTGNPSFSELLKQITGTVLEARDNHEVPFDRIVESLKLPHDASYNPLFQVGFLFQEPPIKLSLTGLSNESLELHSGGAMYDLHLWIWQSDNGIEGYVWYNTDVFDLETIEQFIGHYKFLTSELINAPEKPVRHARLLPDSDLAKINQLARGAKLDLSNDNLVEWFKQTVRENPKKVAARSDGAAITYQQLDEKSDQIAGYLQTLNVTNGDFVGIGLDRDTQMLVALLGIIKLGAAYVPLDPAYPVDRLSYMLEKSEARALITKSALADRFPGFSGETVFIDQQWDQIASRQPRDLPCLIGNETIYVIFTSGSTGLPKGVEVTHSNVVNFLASMANQPGLNADDILLAVTTLSFDIAVLELFLPIVTGGCVVIANSEQAGDGQALIELIEQEQVTALQATPATWRMLISAGWQGGEGFKVLIGGEALPRDLVDEIIDRVGSVWNMYGPTETTVWSTCEQITDKGGPILIGRPIGNTQVYVLDENQLPTPLGVPGELYIGGSGVTRGYLNNPEQTVDRYIDNPFSNEGRLYRTGDRVRYQRDGRLEYLSRLDNQVKIRGFRIELGEIESSLSTLPGVKESVLSVREDRPGDMRLVAYAIADSGADLTITKVRKHLRKSLPEYMIPQHLVELDELPMTPNGKVDRKALPSPMGGGVHDDEYVAPSTETELALAEIWQELLNLERVSIHDNFFDLGGHSLLSIQVIVRINALLGVKLSPRIILFNDFAQIALQCDQQKSRNGQASKAGEKKKSGGLLGKLRDKIKRP
ncbi:MAG: amino acid adenylation domain-containing protein, partial [Immundisolibacteraceae bacterium]|nr:amino acid adenylation domain-containing protein [Immundisolibacteraceae bacterium]